MHPAASAQCETEQSEALNRDGSSIRLVQKQCHESNRCLLQVDVRPDRASPYAMVLRRIKPMNQAPAVGGHLIDIDADGLFEVEEVDYCGAGPNCFRRIHKVDAKTRKSHLFFEGGYFQFRKIGDFYVTSGRSGCCSWEHQIYAKPENQLTIDDQHHRYTITVGADSGTPTKTQCLVSKRIGDDWLLASPPNALLNLCAFYGNHYRLNPPGTQAGP